MPDIDGSIYPNIGELYEVNSHAVEGLVGGRRIRVTAHRDLRRDDAYFWAHYEERVPIAVARAGPDDGGAVDVWVAVDFPWQTGRSINECLGAALGWVNSAGD